MNMVAFFQGVLSQCAYCGGAYLPEKKSRSDDFTLGLCLGKDRSPRVWKHFLFPKLVMEGETVHITVEGSGFYQMYECNNLF
jgi:hypothetical protein